jgi:hypothetical protein
MYSKHMGEKINTYDIVGRLEGKRLLGRTRHRWKGNIEADVKYNARVQHRLHWLRTGTDGRLL